ncbi:unnamed protein product [Arabidopsis lyrata]|uniref:Uncharacterized protein n=1 Tax=Arabidopsis lyrata subsp. lyrata TaxID=81972 RepID=D7LNU8_ARALL|nr:hypothetical protein ARALYDRAFT_347293 [Arabidopsis lyrata subsp. lyrata]CAH8267140.1 unnamed protein product [Arabidopsis lyrata]
MQPFKFIVILFGRLGNATVGKPPNKWQESSRWDDHSHVTELVETLPEESCRSVDANVESSDKNHNEANEEEGANETVGANEEEGANEMDIRKLNINNWQERSDPRLLKRGRDGILRSEGKLNPTDRFTPSSRTRNMQGNKKQKFRSIASILEETRSR